MVALGQVGRNVAAGMTGGLGYFYDEEGEWRSITINNALIWCLPAAVAWRACTVLYWLAWSAHLACVPPAGHRLLHKPPSLLPPPFLNPRFPLPPPTPRRLPLPGQR